MEESVFSGSTDGTPEGLAFTLIHGTIPKIGPFRWAARRSWTDDDSEFMASLRNAFPDARVERFLWSGTNSHAARQSAGVQLARHLAEDGARGRRILIAHSHGGNVALYALRRSPCEIVSQVAGLVFLGTPFLSARPSKSTTLSELWLATWVGGTLGAILLWLAWSGHITIYVVLASLLLGVSVAGAWRLSRLSREAWERLAQEYAQAIDTNLQADIPMYAVCTMRDEALLLLNGVSIITRAMQSLRRRLIDWFIEVAGNCRDHFKSERTPRFETEEEIAEWVRYRRYADPDRYKYQPSGETSTSYIVMIALFAMPMLFLMAVEAVMMILVLPIVALCSTQAIALANLLTRSAPWGFGEHWLLQWLVEVEVSKWPPNEMNLTSIEGRLGVLALRHCALPNDTKFLENIWQWLDSVCLRRRPPARQS